MDMKLKLNPAYIGTIWFHQLYRTNYKPEELDEQDYNWLYKNGFDHLFIVQDEKNISQATSTPQEDDITESELN